MTLPSGTVTFLFTDIEGSTKLAQEHPDEMPALLARHHAILNQAIQAHKGYVFQIVGDSFSAAFHSVRDSLNAALDAQRFLQKEAWAPVPVRVRMGIHTGAAQVNDGNQYTGYTTLAFTQRIMSAGHGGQILLSGATSELARDSLPANTELIYLGERRLKDLLRPERLYQLNAEGLPADFPPLKTLDFFPNNLPTELTTFIGREHEIGELKKLVVEHRSVTLTGAGGAGKTRLSLQVGAQCLEQFPNGVWFVELASFTEPSLITRAVMAAMGIREKDNEIRNLTNHIGNQSVLLILDNCEHLIEDCARLAENLLKACPNLHMLASSREAFGIGGEYPYHVPSMSFPNPKHLPALDEIAKCEAVQLFVERVRAYIPSFSLTEKNASSVVQICSRLDGIPLALELAAARVKVMSVEQLASRLGDVFNLLTSGNRTALPRQQTLRALIEWSYDLLSDSEKSLFRRLSAFSGGWSIEAVEAVCSVEAGTRVLDDLVRLADKSLVIKEEFDGEARFHMLETIRQYAEFKLFVTEEVEELRNHHRDWFMHLAEIAEPKLRTGEQMPWLNRLEMEHDNLRAAIKWSIEQKHIEEALRIPSALAYFWEIHGHGEEGLNWLGEALKLEAQSGERKYPYAWAAAVGGHYSLSAFQPDLKQYQPRMEAALDIFRKHRDSFRVGRTLYHLAYIPHFAGELQNAISKYQEGSNAYQAINDTWGMGECLHCIAHIEEQQGNIEKAHALYNQSLEALQPIGDRFSLFHPMGDTAVIALNRGELDRARMILEESIHAFEELKNPQWTSTSLNRLTEVFCEQGKYGHARKINQRSLLLQREMNYPDQLSWTTELTGKIELAEGNLSLARQRYNEALAIAGKNNNQYSMGFIKVVLGLIDCYEANDGSGKETIEVGIEIVRKNNAPHAIPLLTYRSHALWFEKDLLGAARAYRDTIQELRNNYYFIRIPECLEGLGKIAVTEKDFERAAHLFGAAEAMRGKMETPIPPVQREEYDAHLQTLWRKMGAGFETIREEGRLMTLEQVIGSAIP